MVVYWEYAFAENMLLDGLLLYLALKCARAKVYKLNLILSAAVGGAEAVLFPLIALSVWAAYLVKFAGGILLVLLAVRKGRGKIYLITAGAFFFFTFALGGVLTAAYTFFGVETEGGNAFIVERAPVALVIAVAGIFTVVGIRILRAFYRYRKIQRNLFSCVLRTGDREVKWTGFADSGNLLSFHGEPVCVVSAPAVFALFGAKPHEEGRITVGTVNGGRDRPVFRCDALSVTAGDGRIDFGNVYLTVGDVRSKDYQIILHTSFTEVAHENLETVKTMAGKDSGERKRRKLSLRKRGASAAAFTGRRGGNAEKARRGRGCGGGKGKAYRT